MPTKIPVWQSEFSFASLKTRLMVEIIGEAHRIPLADRSDYADRVQSWYISFKICALEASRLIKPFHDAVCRSDNPEARVGDWAASSFHSIAFDLAVETARAVHQTSPCSARRRTIAASKSAAFANVDEAFAGIDATMLDRRRAPIELPSTEFAALLRGLQAERLAALKRLRAAIVRSELARSLASHGIERRGRGRPTTDKRDIELAKEFAKFGGTYAAFHEKLMPTGMSEEGLRFAVRRGKKLIAELG